MPRPTVRGDMLQNRRGFKYLYLGVWAKGPRRVPYHTFQALYRGFIYQARSLEAVRRQFPTFEGEDAREVDQDLAVSVRLLREQLRQVEGLVSELQAALAQAEEDDASGGPVVAVGLSDAARDEISKLETGGKAKP